MKRILFFVLFLSLVTTLTAQFSIGARAGFNMAGQSGSFGLSDEDYHWIYCFNPGIAANYSFSDLFSLQAEANYANTGSKADVSFVDESGSITDGSLKSLFRSIQIPVLARFSFGSKLRYFGEAGPYFDLIVDGKYKLKYGDEVKKGSIKIKKEPEDNNSDDIMYLDPDTRRKTDFGWYFGAGIQKKTGLGNLVFNVRFGLGLLDIYTFHDPDALPDYKPFRNRIVNISFAYMFDMGK